MKIRFLNMVCFRANLYHNGKLIASKSTNNGTLYFNVGYGLYIIEICSSCIKLKKCIHYYKDIPIILAIYQKQTKKVILTLTDQNYIGLPIERGIIRLWDTT